MKTNIRLGRGIREEVGSWFGVTTGQGRRGETYFCVNGREIGHLHGERAALFQFDGAVRDQLRLAGRITDHPLYPAGQGPAVRSIAAADDAQDVIRLMRINYDIAMARLNRRAVRSATAPLAGQMVAN